ncbi:MAG: DUF1343 domain-containing protein [Thermofilaceae archaeon]
MRVRLGLESPELGKLLAGKKLGIATNHTGVTPEMRHIIEIAGEHGKVEVVFTPEHGLWGSAAAGELVSSRVDEEYGVRVCSLYGETLEPPTEELQKLDLVVYDIQDLGLRWYTYASTLYYTVKACAKAGTPLLVLDRPAPLTGAVTEGPVLDPTYKSFTGLARIPARYALTPGELALYYSRVEGLGGEVHVARMAGWRREMWFDETGLPWVPPSPNIPNLEAALVYAGACLLEGTNLSEGRGTASPFLQFGAPWIRARRLAQALNELRLPGVIFRPVKFVPTASKYRGQECGGAYVHVTDRSVFRPFVTFIEVLKTVKRLYEDRFHLMSREHEQQVEYLKDYTGWSSGASRYAIDYLAGTSRVRECIEGLRGVEEAEEEWRRERNEFIERAQSILLYEGGLRP